MSKNPKKRVTFETMGELGVESILVDEGGMLMPVGYCIKQWGGGWSSTSIITKSEFFDADVIFQEAKTLPELKRKVKAAILETLKETGK